MKPITKEQAYSKAAARCSTAEMCATDIEKKLLQWGISEKEAAEIIAKLIQENYLNEKRFAEAFVHDKVQFDHWGRIKIAQALRMKGIDDRSISAAFENISPEQYAEGLKAVLQSKLRTLQKEPDEYQRAVKLTRFAMSRGFEFEEIKKCIDSGL